MQQIYKEYAANSHITDQIIIPKFSSIKFKKAFQVVHDPKSKKDINLLELSIHRLLLESIFYHEAQNFSYITKNQMGQKKINSLTCLKNILNKTSFYMTRDQRRSLIYAIRDLQSPLCTRRLIKGEVGAGKTFIMILISYYVASCKYQVCVISPTEVLSQQHFKTFSQYITDIEIQFLSSSVKKKERDKLKEDIKTKIPIIVIGTHALLSQDIIFTKLGACIFDEEHKFGVKQKEYLNNPLVDIFSFSATPLPRSLNQESYISNKEKIFIKRHQRLSVITKKLNNTKIDKLIQRIKIQIKRNNQVYWICPRIKSQKSNYFGTIEKRYTFLKHAIPSTSIEILHGKIDKKEQQKIINLFKNKEISILLTTAVVETGIDIHTANIIIIENPTQFGIAQIHQLRGRVGRGGKQGYCILLYDINTINKQKMEKIKKIVESNSGTQLSEYDLKKRGEGALWKTQQSGQTIYDSSLIKNPLEYKKAIYESIKKHLSRNKIIPH